MPQRISPAPAANPAASPVRTTLPELLALHRAAAGLTFAGDAPGKTGSGPRLSPFKGRGMEYAESRHYQPGDDPRTLDWRVTARTGRVHTKLFREERERPVHLWVDYRPPMFFATRGAFKAVLAARAAALLAWSAGRQGDRVGGGVFSGADIREVRPGLSTHSVLRYLRLLTEPLPAAAAGAPLGGVLERLARGVRPGSMLFLFSDFRGLEEAGEGELARLARHSEIVLFFLFDPLERELPPAGVYRLGDGRRQLSLDTGDRRLAAEHRQRFSARLGRLQAMSRYGLRLLPCATSDDPLALLQRELPGRVHPAGR